jgi:GGDEF domain-containing protein
MVLKRLFGKLGPHVDDEKMPPASAEHVAAAVDLQKTMGRDRVTGLPHRACFAHVLTLQGQISSRLETRLSVVVVEWPGYAAPELDPETRDRRLNVLAAALRARLHRTHDVLGHIGDGRLAAMLPFTDGAGADTVARNLQRAGQLSLAGVLAPAAEAAEGLDGFAGTRFADEEDAAVGVDEAPAETGIEPGAGVEPAIEPWTEIEGEIINIGISSYNGKGMLADGALLSAAERAVTFAAMNGGDRIVRFDPGAEMTRL